MLNRVIEIAAALSDPLRVRLLAALRRGELRASQLVVFAAVPPSTLSGHLALLRRAGLVTARRDGRWIHYRLADSPGREAHGALRWVFSALRGDPQARRDRRLVRRVRTRPPRQTARVYLRAAPPGRASAKDKANHR